LPEDTIVAIMSEHGPVPLDLRLFGPFEARVHGAPLPHLRSRKGQYLLALLTLRAGLAAPTDRSWLVGTLWPNSDEIQGHASLRSSLKDLRQALGPEAGRLCSPTPRSLHLDLEGARVDVLSFDAAMARGDPASLESAVALHRGPLLEEWLEPWAFQERQIRERAFLTAVEALAARELAAGDPASAVRRLQQAVAADPMHESAQRALMEALAAGGEYAAALMAYREFRLLLRRELDTEPGPATTALFEQIQAEARDKAAMGARCSRSPHRSQPLDAPGAERGCGSTAPTPGGALPLDSPIYVVRAADEKFRAAIARQDSIVLVKGASQMGKTSLLARGLQEARALPARVLLSDFQLVPASHLESASTFLFGLAEWVAIELGLEVSPGESWSPHRGPSINFQHYFRRHVLDPVATPLVWGLDEVDRLFPCDFAAEVFGMFRSWHNARSLDPTGPWGRLTLAIAYATEARLFITDLNQSPFNVGTRITLHDFTCAQVAELNRRYGGPLRGEAEVARYHQLVGGHPYLVGLGLHEMATHGTGLANLEASACQCEGPFGDHLRRLLALLRKDPDLCEAVREVLRGRPCPSEESFYRLQSAGVLVRDSARAVRPRCRLYATYLEQRLR
jgi:DNA-binding SARP family transcriptional activator